MFRPPAEVTVTLVVSMAPEAMPGEGVCRERGRDGDSGRWEVARRLVVTPLLVGASVGWTERLEAVSPGGCCRVSWVGPGDSTGSLVAATGGFRATVSGAAGVRAGLSLEAVGVSCGSCGRLSLGVGGTRPGGRVSLPRASVGTQTAGSTPGTDGEKRFKRWAPPAQASSLGGTEVWAWR